MPPSSPAPSPNSLSALLFPGLAVPFDIEQLLSEVLLDPQTLAPTSELSSLPTPDQTFTAHSLPLTKDPRQKAMYASAITHYEAIACDDLAIHPYDQPGPLLTNCTLHGAVPNASSALRFWRFVNCDLSRSDFSKLGLTYVVFLSCDLSDVDLSSTQLSKCLFYDCDLTRTNFTSAAFLGTRLLHSDPHPAIFTYARGDDAVANDLAPAYTTGFSPARTPPGHGFLHTLRTDPAWLASQVPDLGRDAAATLLREHPEISATSALALARALYV